ncbi:sodium channel modifier 1 isoform X2 [Taeniopygia guttata]|uniref:sodium channel modifier 1 isoform X2 n=1 Tax=Taeniopygia guttata TaxID=59729 RepID=UPI003BB952B4
MSFKRDESDPGPLRALQRRRVAELLASAIPEDEALLLRDGRLACSLCPQRPVCDTLQTLLLHRAGRKHLDNLRRSFGRPRCPQVTPQEAPGVAPAEQDEGQQFPGGDARGDPEKFPDASRALPEPQEFQKFRNPQPRTHRRRSQGQETGKERKFPDFRRARRKFPMFRRAEPGAAADPAAPPAPAQPGLAPGSCWELGEGRERRVRLRRGGAAPAAAGLTSPRVPRCPHLSPGVPTYPQVSSGVPRAPGIKGEFFWTIFPLYSRRSLRSGRAWGSF